MAAYTTIDNPELYFQTKLYTGNDSDNHSINLDGDENMQPDFLWIKQRGDAGYDHSLTDSVRGNTKMLYTSQTIGEGTHTTGVKSFDSDGFTLGTDDGDSGGSYANLVNYSKNYVAWCWKAGTSFTNDASATSIGDLDSSGSLSQTAGFSICAYTGNGTSGETIKHGLSTAPKIIIIKKSSGGDNWTMLNTNISLNTHLHFTSDGAVSDPMFNNTAPTTSVFTVDSDGQVNGDGNVFIAYCWSEVAGYSKFGKYTGNGNANGPFVWTGFKPAFVMWKKSSGTEDWGLSDNKRDTSNVIGNKLRPNASTLEHTGNAHMDFLSNGWKWRNTNGEYNASGATYIYLAFAEAPFVNSNGVPCNAR